MSGRRATSLSPPERFLLDEWAATLRRTFAAHVWLVGSVARAEDWRDVDVRLVRDDLAAIDVVQQLNVAVSVWGQRATGLPIDFQFQSEDEAHAEQGARLPIGIRGGAA